MGQTNPLKRFLARYDSCMVVRRIPSVLRGLARAETWKDSLLDQERRTSAPSMNPPNPLRAYYDAVVSGRGIWKQMHYLDIYHRHFQKFVGADVHVVEVGVYSGGSLDMWKAYFGPKCMVYGIDIEEACKAYEDERTRVFIGDQGDRRFWKRFREEVPEIDILIDDGGHLEEQQIVTLEETLPYLRGGGVYLCEDITGRHNRFLGYISGLTAALYDYKPRDSDSVASDLISVASEFQRAISSVHRYPFVTVIEKSSTLVDELVGPRRGNQWQHFAWEAKGVGSDT